MVERRDRPTDSAGRPRAFFARRISSNSLIDGWDDDVLSRSWINSLKAVKFVSRQQS